MNPDFDPDMLNIQDNKQFNQQLNHLLMQWEEKVRNRKTKNKLSNTVSNIVQTVHISSKKKKHKTTKENKRHPNILKVLIVTICVSTGRIIHFHEGIPVSIPDRVPVMNKTSMVKLSSLRYHRRLAGWVELLVQSVRLIPCFLLCPSFDHG